MAPHVRYYQRLLARDEDEASVLANRKIAELGSVAAMDEVLVPALRLAEQHHARDEITGEDLDFILESTAEIVALARAKNQTDQLGEAGILMMSTRAPADRIVLDMLATTIEASGRRVATISSTESLEGMVERAISERPELTCVVAVSATRGSEARSICRRIRAARPNAKLLALRPLPDGADAARSVARMKEAGANRVAINLRQALDEVQSMLGPVSASEASVAQDERLVQSA